MSDLGYTISNREELVSFIEGMTDEQLEMWLFECLSNNTTMPIHPNVNYEDAQMQLSIVLRGLGNPSMLRRIQKAILGLFMSWSKNMENTGEINHPYFQCLLRLLGEFRVAQSVPLLKNYAISNRFVADVDSYSAVHQNILAVLLSFGLIDYDYVVLAKRDVKNPYYGAMCYHTLWKMYPVEGIINIPIIWKHFLEKGEAVVDLPFLLREYLYDMTLQGIVDIIHHCRVQEILIEDISLLDSAFDRIGVGFEFNEVTKGYFATRDYRVTETAICKYPPINTSLSKRVDEVVRWAAENARLFFEQAKSAAHDLAESTQL